MRLFIVFSVLIAVTTALPQQQAIVQHVLEGINQNDERIVAGIIEQTIEDVKQSIRDAGLDPYYLQATDYGYALPVPVLFNIQAAIEEFLFTGLSNIEVYNINYNLLTNRVTFDLGLPHIQFSIGKAATDATLFGSSTESHVSGRIAIVQTRVFGNVRVNIGIISGITLRSLDINFAFARIESELNIVTHGRDFSNVINNFLSVIVPRAFNNYANEINELIEIIATQIIEGIL